MNMARHSNDHVNNRQKILDVATKLVMERGVKGTSLADIAREAQISKGTLFYHFAAKDDLIYELTEQHFDRITRSLLQRVEQMHGESLEKILGEGLAAILMAEDRGKLNLYLLQEAVIENPALKARFRSKYQEFQVLAGQFLAMVAPDMDSDQAKVLARVLVAILDGLIIQWLLEPEDISIARIAEILTKLI
jgi:AcrR family transcriptional regulator